MSTTADDELKGPQMRDKQRIPGHGPGFPANPGQPFSSRQPDAVYRAWREGDPLDVTLRVRMSGTEYERVEFTGTGSDGLPITLSYVGHADGQLAVAMFRGIRQSRTTEWEMVSDSRPAGQRSDLA